jgi:hypothetical protein
MQALSRDDDEGEGSPPQNVAISQVDFRELAFSCYRRRFASHDGAVCGEQVAEGVPS